MAENNVARPNQRTLAETIRAVGIGLHTGRKSYMTMSPASSGHGIVFRRDGPKKPVDIPAEVQYTTEAEQGTTITKDGASVNRISAMMSALAGMGVDNCLIELSDVEVPVMDGSAAAYVYLLKTAGFTEQAAPRRFFRVKEKLEVSIKGRDDLNWQWATLEPGDGFLINQTIQTQCASSSQAMSVNVGEDRYINDIASARTFGSKQEFERLRERDLAQGASLDNTVVIDDGRVENDDGLRFKDEFVRHEVLTAIGELYLLGGGLLGKLSTGVDWSNAEAGQAEMNVDRVAIYHDLRKELMRRTDAWEFV